MQALVKNDLLRARLTYILKWPFSGAYNSIGRDLVPTRKLKKEKEQQRNLVPGILLVSRAPRVKPWFPALNEPMYNEGRWRSNPIMTIACDTFYDRVLQIMLHCHSLGTFS